MHDVAPMQPQPIFSSSDFVSASAYRDLEAELERVRNAAEKALEYSEETISKVRSHFVDPVASVQRAVRMYSRNLLSCDLLRWF